MYRIKQVVLWLMLFVSFLWASEPNDRVRNRSPLIAMIMLTSTTLTLMTELTSNVATTMLFMPILASTAPAIHAHPLLLMIPRPFPLPALSCCRLRRPLKRSFLAGYVTVP